MIRHVAALLSIAGMAGISASCDVETLLNRTASFGGDVAGQRSTFSYVVINNTPRRAIFTVGAYDDLDQNTQPQLQQFGNDSNPNRQTLEANSSSATFRPNCAKVFAIGTPQLLTVIEDNVPADNVDSCALVDGVFFFSGDLSEENECVSPSGIEVMALPLEKRLGEDFVCNSFLQIRLEIDDVGPTGFRIAFAALPAIDDRNPPS